MKSHQLQDSRKPKKRVRGYTLLFLVVAFEDPSTAGGTGAVVNSASEDLLSTIYTNDTYLTWEIALLDRAP